MGTAVITGLFTLGGVLVGGLANVLFGYFTDRRTARREAKVTGRLLADDLRGHAVELDSAVKLGVWLPAPAGHAALNGWREHRALLAAALPRQEWRLLTITFRRISSVGRATAVHRTGDAMNKMDATMIQGAVDYAERSATMLVEFAELGPFSRKRQAVTPDEVRSGLFLDEPDWE